MLDTVAMRRRSIAVSITGVRADDAIALTRQHKDLRHYLYHPFVPSLPSLLPHSADVFPSGLSNVPTKRRRGDPSPSSRNRVCASAVRSNPHAPSIIQVVARKCPP